MDYLTLRKMYGDPHISGVGMEIGAGLRPVLHDNIEKLYFFDKRRDEEFEEHFGEPPPYELITIETVTSRHPDGLDFITSHHVIEHLDSPLGPLTEWIGLLRAGGIFYFSIPSPNNTTERNRPLTTTRHVLEDHFFHRPIWSYESKQHLFTFMEACAASGGIMMPWYAEKGVAGYAEYLLQDVKDRNDQDAHWHTYSLDTTREILEIAFHMAGCRAETLVAEESDDSHYLVMRKMERATPPQALTQFLADMQTAVMDVQQAIGAP